MLQGVVRGGPVLAIAASLTLVFQVLAAAPAGELRQGLSAGAELNSLPLPASGYEVYLVGEMHGLLETEGILQQYLAKLYTATGLRDVAIEEKAVYQPEAQAYVHGLPVRLPDALCLRAGVLGVLRRFNEGRKAHELVRVHLVDIDSSAASIHEHLLRITERTPGGKAVRVPDPTQIEGQALASVAALRKLTSDPAVRNELRTVEHSIRAHQQGLEIGTGQFKGSPYLDAREQAITDSIQDLLRDRNGRAVLALYGYDHVSKARRKDGGEKRNQAFAPLALRLQEAGVKVFSLLTFPLSGASRWRGREGQLPWAASDGSLANGETLDRVLAAAPDARFFYADRSRLRIKLPSQDVTAYAVDAILLLRSAMPMEDHCTGTSGRASRDPREQPDRTQQP